MGKKTLAYTGPFIVFMLFLLAAGALDWARVLPGGVAAMYIIFPLQTVVCAGMLAWYWREYGMSAPRGIGLAAGIGMVVLVLWIAPGWMFHLRPRLDGFDPGLFANRPVVYWGELVMRLVRLAVVVPLLEEIFWRGFLLRWLIDEDFDSVPFGQYALKANLMTGVAFMLEHSSPDWPAALAAGLLYNMVAYRTRSLSSCVLAHAITNALLGVFILATRQWGYW